VKNLAIKIFFSLKIWRIRAFFFTRNHFSGLKNNAPKIIRISHNGRFSDTYFGNELIVGHQNPSHRLLLALGAPAMASELQAGTKQSDEGGEEESAVATKQIKWGSNSSGTQRTYVSTVTVVCFYR
jgi:hypothetical protein